MCSPDLNRLIKIVFKINNLNQCWGLPFFSFCICFTYSNTLSRSILTDPSLRATKKRKGTKKRKRKPSCCIRKMCAMHRAESRSWNGSDGGAESGRVWPSRAESSRRDESRRAAPAKACGQFPPVLDARRVVFDRQASSDSILYHLFLGGTYYISKNYSFITKYRLI